MNLNGKSTLFMSVITVLWVVITLMGWTGYWLPAMYLGVILMLLYMMLGAAKQGKLSTKLLLYPLLPWAVLWIASFALSKYYADVFSGSMPDFTILGFHPSFAWTIITYWLGGVATITLGFVAFKDLWLSEKDWDDFKEKVNKISAKEGVK